MATLHHPKFNAMNRRKLYIALCTIILCQHALIEARCSAKAGTTVTIAAVTASALSQGDLVFLAESDIVTVLMRTSGMPWSLSADIRSRPMRINSRTCMSTGRVSKKVGSKDSAQVQKVRSSLMPGIIGIAQDLLSNMLAVILGSLAAYSWRGMRRLRIKNAEKIEDTGSE